MKTPQILTTLLLITATLLTTACSTPQQKNKVIVLGMIHSDHKTSEPYSLKILAQTIKDINPDFVLTEIPPDRFDQAMTEFKTTGTITESRVARFPEYTTVLFPLTKELNFQIIPCAGWTKAMADDRNQKLKAWQTQRPDQTAEVNAAQERIESIMQSEADPNDPLYIHTTHYDNLVEQALEPYNRLFNNDLGPGGWDNINQAHYNHIQAALNAHTGQGKTFLITFGAWHKYWFINELNKRTDIVLLDPKPYFK